MLNSTRLSSAIESRNKVLRGECTLRDIVDADIKRIDALEPEIRAFAYYDSAHVNGQADRLVDEYAGTQSAGPLYGVTVGVKDIIDTADMPTENGTVLDVGRQPATDASVVDRLRRAGAVIMGKTVTSELANRGPGKTRNPHDYSRTPGGSSSGSAAAVASGMVSAALGTQTGGSVIRPSAFCGVVGFKPSVGFLPRTGVLAQSSTLDTVGVHARSIDDAALLAQTLHVGNAEEDSSPYRGNVDLLGAARREPASAPRVGFVKQAVWSRASAATQDGLLALVRSLGDACREVPLSRQFENAHASHRCIHVAEMAKCYRDYMNRGRTRLSDALQAAMDEGAAVSAVDYQLALDHRRQLMSELEQHWRHFDIIVTPAANGEAPLGLESTGDPAFCAIWTMLGVPSVTLPLLKGDAGMPIGVQLVARRGADADLLSNANWFSQWFRRNNQA